MAYHLVFRRSAVIVCLDQDLRILGLLSVSVQSLLRNV